MKIVVKPHSFIDLITNSSTEVFVCNRGHTLEQVQRIVDDLLDLFHYSHYEKPIVQEAEDGWEEEYYGEGAILIEVDQYSIHPELASLLLKIFDTGERNEDADY
jgi:hypothetical protein